LSAATRKKLDALAADLTERKLKASAHVVDIRKADAVNALLDAVWSAHGRPDSLLSSAGGKFSQSAIDFSVKGWNAVIDTYLNGIWYLMQAAARGWRDRKHGGSIVNVVVVTTHGLYRLAHSIAARSGVIDLSRAVASALNTGERSRRRRAPLIKECVRRWTG
jgi:citronellol/citronellal dehydrogenase